jgi:hypothetical protein
MEYDLIIYVSLLLLKSGEDKRFPTKLLSEDNIEKSKLPADHSIAAGLKKSKTKTRVIPLNIC